MIVYNPEYNLEEYIEKLKTLTEHSQREVCLFINFMKYYEEHENEVSVDDMSKMR